MHPEETEGLTFAGVRCRFWTTGVSGETLFTVLAVATLGVVAAVVTHAATPPSRGQPQPAAEVTALGMTIALALCVWRDTHNERENERFSSTLLRDLVRQLT